MKTASLYNQIASQSLERLGALSDGVFAIAMTLLVLELHLPTPAAIHTDKDLWIALGTLAPQMISYLMSFLALGIFWAGQQTQLNHFTRSNRTLSWIHFAFLCVVCLMPFSTNLLAEFITLRLALIVYWLNILVLGLILYASWKCASRHGLIKEDLTHEVRCAIERRVLGAQALYAFGAALCLVNNYWSIGFILLVQLSFACAPSVLGILKI